MLFRAVSSAVFCFLLLYGETVCSAAGNKQVRVEFGKNAPEKLYLYSFFGIKTAKIDSSKADPTGSFHFDISEHIKTGYYRLSVNDTNYIDVILSGKENVVLTAKGPSLKKDVEVKSSAENKALWALKSSRLAYNSYKNKLYLQQQGIKNDPVKLHSLKRSFDSLENSFNSSAFALFSKHKDTYFYLTNKIIISPLFTDSSLLIKNYRKDTFSFLKENFFNNIDFSRAELVNSTLLPNQYMKYFEKYVEYDEKGFKKAVDFILAKAKANPVVYEFTLDFLLQLFDEAGPALIFEYLVETYYDSNTCNASVVENVTRLKSLSPGKLLPETELTGFQPYKTLKDVYSGNKFTVIYFWSSHCSFCAESLPLIKETYDKYHSSGFEVLGISLDENEKEWNEYIKKNEIKWLNYNEMKGWDSGIVRKMMVNKTPTFFLVNGNGVIVGKNYNFVEVKKLIENLLN